MPISFAMIPLFEKGNHLGTAGIVRHNRAEINGFHRMPDTFDFFPAVFQKTSDKTSGLVPRVRVVLSDDDNLFISQIFGAVLSKIENHLGAGPTGTDDTVGGLAHGNIFRGGVADQHGDLGVSRTPINRCHTFVT
jgi:hypothetical protein